MSPYLLTSGVVLRRTDTKEADQILTLLTAEHGKIPVIARGVKRKGCRYAAAAGLLGGGRPRKKRRAPRAPVRKPARRK